MAGELELTSAARRNFRTAGAYNHFILSHIGRITAVHYRTSVTATVASDPLTTRPGQAQSGEVETGSPQDCAIMTVSVRTDQEPTHPPEENARATALRVKGFPEIKPTSYS